MIHLEMLLAGVIGILLQSLVKIQAMNKRLPNENRRSVFIAYWREDYLSVLVSFVVLVAVIFISSEWISLEKFGYKAQNFIKTIFVCVGYMANSVFLNILSRTEQKLKDKIIE